MLPAIFGPNGSVSPGSRPVESLHDGGMMARPREIRGGRGGEGTWAIGARRTHAGYVLTIRLGDQGTVVNIERQRLQRLRDFVDQALTSAS
jgi:hypothetical protein